MRKTLACLLALALLCLGLIPLRAEAASTVLDPSQPCSLTLHYDWEGAGFPDLEISIHRFAEVHANLTFDLVAPYDTLPVNIHGITSQQQWNTVASTLSAYIDADNIQPTATGSTDSEGAVAFTDLQSGLYLVSRVVAQNSDGIYLFDAFVILVPTNYDNAFHYDVDANPKCTEFIPAEEYRVIKLWKDTGSENLRPNGVTVEIYRDGVLMETVVLNSGNNWSHSWKVPPGDTGLWTVAERDVSRHYQVSISQNAFTFTITNTKDPTPSPPQTGDSFAVLPWVLAMCLSGSLLIVLDIYRRRQST